MSIFKKITFTCLVGCATSFYTSHAMEEKSPMDVEETSNVGSTHSLDYKQMETALEQEFSQMDFGGNQKKLTSIKVINEDLTEEKSENPDERELGSLINLNGVSRKNIQESGLGALLDLLATVTKPKGNNRFLNKTGFAVHSDHLTLLIKTQGEELYFHIVPSKEYESFSAFGHERLTKVVIDKQTTKLKNLKGEEIATTKGSFALWCELNEIFGKVGEKFDNPCLKREKRASSWDISSTKAISGGKGRKMIKVTNGLPKPKDPNK